MRRVVLSCILAVFLLCSGAIAAADAFLPKGASEPAEVVFEGEVLFSVLLPEGTFSPEERAGIIEDRLSRLAEEEASLPALNVFRENNEWKITAGQVLIHTVREDEALLAGVDVENLARQRAERMQTALETYKSVRTWEGRVRLAAIEGGGLLVFLCLGWLWKRIGRLVQNLIPWVATLTSARAQLQNWQVLTPLVVEARLRQLWTVIYRLGWLMLLYIYASFSLSFFSWTKDISGKLLSFLLGPVGQISQWFVDQLPNLMMIVVVLFFSRYALRLIHTVFRQLQNGNLKLDGFYAEWAEPTYRIVRLLWVLLILVVIFPYIPGSNSEVFKGVSVFVGVLVSLGSSSLMSQIMAGAALIYTRAFRVGDRIKVGDVVGDVLEKGLLAIKLQTVKNEEITIPNATMLSSHVMNYSLLAEGPGLILFTEVTIGYDVPWRKVHELLLRAAQETGGILDQPSSFILQRALNDFYGVYQLNAYTRQPQNMLEIYSELHQRIQDIFFEAGVEIMSPHYIAVRDGNALAIPKEYPAAKAPPSNWRVEMQEKK
ncbi:mechanosensitive ion channel family protein [Anaeroarcus burkinensis]|uniref:mechanosensitive ion channel family protein n=1 Tax=Anaeroarcus burkinensis TaxID=82376 RepID=UPI0005696B2F|nr:mechanosensitive ion channel domain-containing protein [Anaeroarcus burkinensis]